MGAGLPGFALGLEQADGGRRPGADPHAESRNRQRDHPTRRAPSSSASRLRRTASRTNDVAGGATNSPFDTGCHLIGSPGSSSCAVATSPP